MQLFLERLIYFWAGITAIGLLVAVAYWAIATIIYVAFISLFVSIVAIYWKQKSSLKPLRVLCNSTFFSVLHKAPTLKIRDYSKILYKCLNKLTFFSCFPYPDF